MRDKREERDKSCEVGDWRWEMVDKTREMSYNRRETGGGILETW